MKNATPSPFATSRIVSDLRECDFYHTMELPGYGLVQGQWDLRGMERTYLGGVDFRGKRVLEVGPASGFLTFYMEQQGAEVVACDLSEKDAWDVVPLANRDYSSEQKTRQAGLRRINNAFWLAHRQFNSQSQMVYSSIYNLPPSIGEVDIAVYSAVLIHLRDPFLGLQKGLQLTRERAIITEQVHLRYLPFMFLATTLELLHIHAPLGIFIPSPRREKMDSWWAITPAMMRVFLRILGFGNIQTRYHYRARYYGKRKWMYTMVAERTQPFLRNRSAL